MENNKVEKITISLVPKTMRELEELQIVMGEKRSRAIARLINEAYAKLHPAIQL